MSHDMFTAASEEPVPPMRTWKEMWVERWARDMGGCLFRSEGGWCLPADLPCTMENCEFARRGIIDGMLA